MGNGLKGEDTYMYADNEIMGQVRDSNWTVDNSFQKQGILARIISIYGVKY